VKDSNSTKKEYVESGIHVKNESFICRGHSENCCRLGLDVIANASAEAYRSSMTLVMVLPTTYVIPYVKHLIYSNANRMIG